MRIAVDAMGGDYAPEEVVKGACKAAAELGIDVLLVGDGAKVAPFLDGVPHDRVEILHASDVVGMGAHPLEAVRKQRDSSIVVAANSVKRGQAHALVSAGSTGAAMAAALLNWGRIKGIDRPAIGTVIPTMSGACVLLDSGAQVDVRANHLSHFAVMGAIYAERVLGIANPRVGLLNIGEEETKGSQLVLESYPRLKADSRLNFIGNIEGRDILSGNADVVVCDGFVGNVVLKFAEGMAKTLFGLIKTQISTDWRTKAGGLLLKNALGNIRAKFDYTEYGGAPLLGVQGVCVISHGSSNAKAIRNAIRVAAEAVERQLVERISTSMTDL